VEAKTPLAFIVMAADAISADARWRAVKSGKLYQAPESRR
jgi:hypothetical protein